MTLHLQITIRKAMVFLIDFLVIAAREASYTSCQEWLFIDLDLVMVSLVPIRQLLHDSGSYERDINEQ
jgi:hypothetical protein